MRSRNLVLMSKYKFCKTDSSSIFFLQWTNLIEATHHSIYPYFLLTKGTIFWWLCGGGGTPPPPPPPPPQPIFPSPSPAPPTAEKGIRAHKIISVIRSKRLLLSSDESMFFFRNFSDKEIWTNYCSEAITEFRKDQAWLDIIFKFDVIFGYLGISRSGIIFSDWISERPSMQVVPNDDK